MASVVSLHDPGNIIGAGEHSYTDRCYIQYRAQLASEASSDSVSGVARLYQDYTLLRGTGILEALQ